MISSSHERPGEEWKDPNTCIQRAISPSLPLGPHSSSGTSPVPIANLNITKFRIAGLLDMAKYVGIRFDHRLSYPSISSASNRTGSG